MGNLDWLTNFDVSSIGTSSNNDLDWLDEETVSAFNKSIKSKQPTQTTGAGSTLAPISNSLPSSKKLDLKIDNNIQPVKQKREPLIPEVDLSGDNSERARKFDTLQNVFIRPINKLYSAGQDIGEKLYEMKTKSFEENINNLAKNGKNFVYNTIKGFGDYFANTFAPLEKGIARAGEIIKEDPNTDSFTALGTLGKAGLSVGRGLVGAFSNAITGAIVGTSENILGKQTGKELGEGIVGTVFMPVVALTEAFKDRFRSFGMDEETASNSRAVLSAVSLGLNAGNKGPVKGTDLVKTLDEGISGGVASPTVKNTYRQYTMKIHPDRLAKDLENSPELFAKAQELQTRLNNAVRPQNFNHSEFEAVIKDIDTFLDSIKDVINKNNISNKGGYIDIDNILNITSLGIKPTIEKIIKGLDKDTPRNEIIDLINIAGIFPESSLKVEMVADYIQQQLGQSTKGSVTEYIKQGLEQVNKSAKKIDIQGMEDSMSAINDIIKETLPEEQYNKVMEEFNKMKKFIEEYKYQTSKKQALENEFSPELIKSVEKLKTNIDRAVSQKTLDKYSAIEANKGSSKVFQDVYDAAKDFIEQRKLDMTVDELVQNVLEKMSIPSKRITKAEVLKKLEGNKEIKPDITETDEQFLKEIETLPEKEESETKNIEVSPKEELETIDGIESPDETTMLTDEKIKPDITSKKPSITKLSERIKARKELKSSEEKLSNIAKELKKFSKGPKVTDIAKLIDKHGEKILNEVLDYGVKKNMFKQEDTVEFREAISKIKRKDTQTPTGRLSPKQRLEIQDMLGYDKLFKKIDDQKIVIAEVEEGLKNTQSRLHIVNTPTAKRVKLPFTLMGNKSATFSQVLLPMIQKAGEQGAEIYIEPFGGAGTVYYFIEDMIKSGIKEFNINHFDNEKYEIINAIKTGKIEDIRTEVSVAYATIINDISEVLAEIPEAKEIIEAYGIEARGQYFKDIAVTFFYPQYAKQFFEERPDAKLAIKGELTEIFKDWLGEHIKEKYKESGKNLTPEEVQEAVDLILSDNSVFENRYPEISKKIGEILDKYDGVDFEKGDYKSAMLVAVARHFRQRGDSGQRVVSASNGFQNVIGIKDKMIEGLEKYKEVFDRYGDKINIYNMDGKEFIKEMGKEKNSNKTITYFDPPYIRTTGVYIKNQPKEIQESLQEYSDPTKISQLFEPLKDSIMIFTNDINGKYFEALNKMTDRISKNIIAYKEGTTPTSLLFTKEIEVTPKQVGLSYYSIVKDRFIKDIQESLEKGLLPKISQQMKKHLAKFEQHIIDVFKDKFGDLTQIQNELYEGRKAFEKLEEGLSEITSLRDRQKIISEAKEWLKQNKVTGSDVVKMIDKINRLWIHRQAIIREIKGLLKEAEKTDTIDAVIKKELFNFMHSNYTENKITGPLKDVVKAINNIEIGGDFSEKDLEIYEKYLSDEKYFNKINEAKKTSIYDLDIDQLYNLRKTIQEYIQTGKDIRKNKKLKDEVLVNELIEKYGSQVKKVKSFQHTRSKILQAIRVKDTKMGRILDEVLNFKETKSKKRLLEIMPPDYILDEELGIHQLVYEINNEKIGEYRDEEQKVLKEMSELEKKLKLSKKSRIKIGLHGLANRGDGMGMSKIYAFLTRIGDPFSKKELSPEEVKQRMYEYRSKEFLNERETEMYNFMIKKIHEIGLEVRQTKLDVDNVLIQMMDAYFPIKINISRNPEKFSGVDDPDISEKKVDLFRTVEINNRFTKNATAAELIPELDARKIFYNHVRKALYYAKMQKPLKILNDAINKLGEEKLGDLGYGYAKDYINVLARHGILETNVSLTGRAIAWLNKNFQQSVLGYSIQTVLLQTSGILQAKNVGIKIKIKNLPKMINKEIWDMIDSKSQIMRNRETRNMYGYEGDKLDYGLLEKFNKTGFIPLKFADKFIAKWMWYNKYQELIKKGSDEKQAIYEADRDVVKALGNTHFEGKSLFILKHERGRVSFLTMFQTFVSYIFANIYYGGGKVREKLSGKYGKYIHTGIFLLILMALYEELIRRKSKEILYGITSKDSLISSVLGNMIGYIPILNTFYGSAKYGGIATFKGSDDVIKGFAERLRAYQEEDKEWTNTKIINLLAGLGTFFGIAGTAEATRWAKKIFGEAKKKKIKSGSKSIGDIDLGDIDVSGIGNISDLGDISDLGNIDVSDIGNIGY